VALDTFGFKNGKKFLFKVDRSSNERKGCGKAEREEKFSHTEIIAISLAIRNAIFCRKDLRRAERRRYPTASSM
jgi:hypothetical protein